MPPPLPESVDLPAKGASLPLVDSGGRPLIDVRINGKGPYRFVVSTGANVTIIDTELNKELELPPVEGVQAAGGATIVNIRELRMGEISVRGFMGAVMPLAPIFDGENAPRGIVSAALFQSYLLTWDYPKKRLTVEKGKLDKADQASIFEYSESRPTLPVKLGTRETRVPLDTSSIYGLTLPLRLLTEIPLAAPAKQAGTRRTSGGEFPVQTASLGAPVEIGQHKLQLKEVAFSDARAGSGPPTGSIGCEVLRNFVVTLDTWNHRIRLTQ